MTNVADSDSRRALGKLLTLLDDGDNAGFEELGKLGVERLPYIVGITGSAGVGKSSLLKSVLDVYPVTGSMIGVIVIDPTSPVTGGALLGDRVRMPSLPDTVFARSVATRGSQGGLSEKLLDLAAAMHAYGCEEVFVETAGIGQDEHAVRQVADTVVFVEAPGMGDEVQAMKASPIEFADVVVVNKKDRDGADETAAFLRDTRHVDPVITSAINSEGIGELVKKIDEHKKEAGSNKEEADRKKFIWRYVAALTKKYEKRLEQSVQNIEAGQSLSELYARMTKISAYIPDHVAVAVEDLDTAIAQYEKIGFLLESREEFPSEDIEVAFFNAGGFHIEVMRPTSDESPMAKFIKKTGGGLHHVSFEVDSAEETEKALRKAGVELAGTVRKGTHNKNILFAHPKSASRVLIEFCSCINK